MQDCHDFYACELAQVKMKQWSTGRVVLLGDAGYSPSVMTGMGTTCSLVGAYVLAGELARHGDDMRTALEEYERVVRPAVAGYQVLPSGMSGNFMPSSRLGLWFVRNTLWAISALKIDQMILRVLPKREDKFDWTVPDYPELNLRS
jgi:2-polyprenyl-6-methoxyphenol hydroxylase-like FAD-dependent oxidoreductase